jgi:hypothetical protein
MRTMKTPRKIRIKIRVVMRMMRKLRKGGGERT